MTLSIINMYTRMFTFRLNSSRIRCFLLRLDYPSIEYIYSHCLFSLSLLLNRYILRGSVLSCIHSKCHIRSIKISDAIVFLRLKIIYPNKSKYFRTLQKTNQRKWPNPRHCRRKGREHVQLIILPFFFLQIRRSNISTHVSNNQWCISFSSDYRDNDNNYHYYNKSHQSGERYSPQICWRVSLE